MQTIALANEPDQSLTVTLDDDRYAIRIFQAVGCMACDIARNEQVIVTGSRITNGTFLITFFGYEGAHGNFLLETESGQLPDYNQFGITQTLFYISAQEIADIIGGTVP